MPINLRLNTKDSPQNVEHILRFLSSTFLIFNLFNLNSLNIQAGAAYTPFRTVVFSNEVARVTGSVSRFRQNTFASDLDGVNVMTALERSQFCNVRLGTHLQHDSPVTK